MTLLIAGHAAAATVALLLGAHVLLRRRKGDRLHRRVGAVWALAMYATLVSSFWIRELRDGGFSWIHGLSLLTFCTLTAALWAAVTGRARLHRGLAIGSYFGVVGAFLWAVGEPRREIPQLLVHSPGAFTAALITCCAVAFGIVRLAGWRSRSRPLVPVGG